jgi:hypothetical protein
MSTILICGGSDSDPAKVLQWLRLHFVPLHSYYLPGTPARIVSGGAQGADYAAEVFAQERGIDLAVYKADWLAHGRAAGSIKNQRMLDEEKPDLVIAFPGGRGTADVKRRAREAGVPVYEVRW